MRLLDLDAEFVGEYHERGYRRFNHIEGAQGVLFQCPVCAVGKEPGEEVDDLTGERRRFFRGAHYVLCWFSNPRNAPAVPADAFPRPGRWQATGETIDTLTLSPSVLLQSGCGWHGWVKNGDAA